VILVGLHVAQAAIYAAIGWELWHRWPGDAALLGIAALAQLVGIARRPGLERWLHLASLAAVTVVYARFGAVALHVRDVFGPLTGKQLLDMGGAALLALPWLAFFPVARLGRRPPGRVALLLPLAALPVVDGLRGLDPGTPVGADTLATALWARWSGATTPLPPTEPDVRVRVTTLHAGAPVGQHLGSPAEVAAALTGRPGPGDALLVDVAEADLPAVGAGVWLARPGTDAPGIDGTRAPTLWARTASRAEVVPTWSVPVAHTPAVRWRSALASADGVVTLERGWAAGPATVDSAGIDAALHAAVLHLAHGQQADGRFTYIVKGPSGDPGKGYNYPRHAGTTWFLARVAAATGDAEAATTAEVALGHLRATTRTTDDGRAYVLDPSRDDGKSWIGTTALAALALTVRRTDDALLAAYVHQVAASVDPAGKVRGEMRVKDGSFFDQDANAYGQGQAMLALAAAERVGINDGKDALDRAIRYLDDGYLDTAHPIAVEDEHWTCLAARAIRDVRGVDAGGGICAAYVADERWGAPLPGGGLVPATGPGAGAAEALAARAWDTRDPALIDAVRGWAGAFLAAQYRAADAPLLVHPAALIGGFRNGVADLDVQIDTVQHIGCALLGAEALLAGRARPGSLP
jgi:hypothetical protein